MQHRIIVAVLAMVLSLAAGRAEAVTVRDIIELSKAGLSDTVLLALVATDRSVFAIDTATLKQLKSEGVSDAVIVALLKSGRDPRVADPAAVPEEAAPVEQETSPAAAQEPTTIPFPVYVAVPVWAVRGPSTAHGAPERRGPKHDAHIEAAPNCRSAQVPQWGIWRDGCAAASTLPATLIF